MKYFGMKKLLIIIIVAIVTVTTVIAVTAYTSATVGNSMEFKIVATDVAKLALSPGEINYDEYVKVNISEQHGVLELELSFGSNSIEEFTYTDVFQITNNSEKNITLLLYTDLSYIDSLIPENSILSPGQKTSVIITIKSGDDNDGNNNTTSTSNKGIIKVEAASMN